MFETHHERIEQPVGLARVADIVVIADLLVWRVALAVDEEMRNLQVGQDPAQRADANTGLEDLVLVLLLGMVAAAVV